eukprot:s2230_g8.t1
MYQPLSDGVPPISTTGWQAPQDLQKFLEGFYQYFEVKGFRGIVALHFSHIIALSFTIVFSFVLLFLIDWEAILSCDSEESCQSLSIWYAWHWQNLGLRRWLVLLSTLIFSLYWGFNVYQMVSVCMQACQMRSFYKEQLGIVSDESLETMLWSEVVSRLVQCQKEARLCIVQEELTALEITNIIMRQDNFIIGLTDHDAFTKNLPGWIPRRLVYTKAPLWNILLAIFPPVGAEALDHRGRLRQEFLDRPEGGKKGGKKKAGDPFLRKEWYDIKAPSMFSVRNCGKTLVSRTQGTKIATEELKGRVLEVNLADLNNDEDQASKKIRLCIEEVQGRSCLTDFHGMTLTRDKICSLIKKWQTLIEAHVDVKTTDGYVVRLFCIAFTKRRPDQVRANCYAQSAQIRKIRKKMVEIMTAEASKVQLRELVKKLIPESIGKEIEKQTQGIFPLKDCLIRKVKILKKPKFDITKLMELHGDGGDDAGVEMMRPEADDAMNTLTADVLARKFRFLALINLVLLLPVSMFVGVYFFMRHAQEFRSQRTSPFRKQWSDYAYWTFREYNELPHQVDARMCTAQGAAEAYIHATKPTSPVLKSLLRCAKFISGSILAALLLVALWDDTPLLFVKVQEKNLLWYLAFFGFIFAVVDSAGEEDSGVVDGTLMIYSEGKGSGSEACLHALSTPLRMYVALMKMVSCTHYLPGSWRSPAKITSLAGACSGLRRATLCKHFRRVRQELLCDFLLHRIQALAEELLGVLANPLLLWCLSDAAPEIARTMRLLQHSTPALGDWCVYGCLDPALCGDSLISLDGRQAYPGFRSVDNQTFNEKLDKSVLSFLLNHQLLWFPDDGGPDDCRPADYFHDFYSPPICSTRASRSSSPRSIPSHPSHGIPLQDFASDPRCNGKSTGSNAANAVSLEMTETLEWHADGPPGEAPSMPSDDRNGGVEGALEERLPISWHAEGANAETKKSEPNDWVLTHILGAPPTATKLLKEVQEFEESEMRDNGTGENYSMLPAELVRLPPITPGAPAHIAIENAAKLAVDEQRQDGLDMFGALFFWLEALRKSHRAGEETSNGNGGVFCRQPPRFLGGDFT